MMYDFVACSGNSFPHSKLRESAKPSRHGSLPCCDFLCCSTLSEFPHVLDQASRWNCVRVGHPWMSGNATSTAVTASVNAAMASSIAAVRFKRWILAGSSSAGRNRRQL